MAGGAGFMLDMVNAFKMDDYGAVQAQKTQQALQSAQAGEAMLKMKNQNVLRELSRGQSDLGVIGDQYQQRTGDLLGAEALRETRRKNELSSYDSHLKALELLSKSSKMVSADNYDSWRQSMVGMGLAGPNDLPATYDPDVIDRLSGAATEKLSEINLKLPGGQEKQLIVRGGRVVHEGEPVERWQARAPRQAKTVEIYDPTSPSGTRIVTAEQAIGQPGKPPSKALSITGYDEQGRPLIEMGGQPMAAAARNQIETGILDSGDTLSALTAIRSRFRPEFQEVGSRWDALKLGWKSKAGADLSREERTRLQNFSSYRSEAGQFFSQTLKSLSGAAVTEPEMRRAEAWLPNTGTGLFDGDSPVVLESKIARLEDFTRKALAKATFIRRHGLAPEDLDIEQMPGLIRQRGDEIANELSARGVQGAELKRAVKMRLSDEFGLGAAF